MTFGVVIFTVLVQGLTIRPLAVRLGLAGGKPGRHGRKKGLAQEEANALPRTP